MAFNFRCAKHREQEMKTWAADMIFIKNLNDSKKYYTGFKNIIPTSKKRSNLIYKDGSRDYINHAFDTWKRTQEIAHKIILPTMTGIYRSIFIANLNNLVLLQNKLYDGYPTDADYKMYDMEIDSILGTIKNKVINDEMRVLHLSPIE